MGKARNASKALTHEEVWDDTALVQSWDEAVEEYKLYHSIHAKGENFEDVLREAEAAEHAQDASDGQDPDANVEGAMETNGEAAVVSDPSETAQTLLMQPSSQTAEGKGASSETQSTGGSQFMAEAASPGTAMPQAALAQVQDEGLKNLMMSWYFAGYYTGLYEGQQQANRSKSS
ncbi:hypothetical protein EYZ11_012302 [Aspergillus tanneri]|uniref:Survival Motor Neuron Gemin2-binding domain-containing protein n=1 Tax=Aspergillus tanneri TaxID=1220188 RepID=A0A4S3J0M2_9EURO|nr:uncharacterized protein ATNIH1004_005088 [Aspergillus tanneri]KAA8649193.1 hypothetical protein ATNIH1004_005088 [Aspergillus tanneri]THC88256.1 hypothetical protein EYZ11_012302 [Aspergillus tanneri]